MKHISFYKYKEHLESLGYVLDKGTNIYYDLKFITYFFTPVNKPKTKCIRQMVNVFLDKNNNPTDHVISISLGNGSPYIGWNKVEIDMRRKYWKQFM